MEYHVSKFTTMPQWQNFLIEFICFLNFETTSINRPWMTDDIVILHNCGHFCYELDSTLIFPIVAFLSFHHSLNCHSRKNPLTLSFHHSLNCHILPMSHSITLSSSLSQLSFSQLYYYPNLNFHHSLSCHSSELLILPISHSITCHSLTL